MTLPRFLAVVALLVMVASVAGDGQESFPQPTFPGTDQGQRPIPSQRGREGPQDPVFRTRADAIALDVFVTDAKGTSVSGLTVDDFELEEDGKRQDITTFQAVDIPREISSTDFPPAEPDVATNDQPEGRTYVFAFAAPEPDQALRTRAFLRTFMERHFEPNDIAAVVQLGKGLATDGQDFTSNRRLILAAIDKLSGWSAGGEGFRELNEDPRVMTQALNEVIQVLGRMPGRHKSLLYFNTSPGYPWGDLIDYNGFGVGCLGTNQLGCFGPNVNRLIFDDAHGAMSIATRNNITIYPISPAGVTGSVLLSQDYRSLAEMTGGFAHVNSNDFDGAFERIVRDASTYYMLGFNSDYKSVDGKYVRLKVRVKRPGLTVRSRSGYVSTNRNEYETALKTRVASREPVVTALANPVASPGHPLRVTAVPFKGTNGNANVVLTIETGLVPAVRQPRAGERSSSVQIRYLATDAKRKIYPEFRHQTTLSMPVAQADATGNRIRLVSEMELPEGRYQIRVAGGADRNSGGVVYDLDVPDFSKQPLTMSGLTLAATPAQALPTVQAVHDKKKIKTRTCREGECVSADVREVPLVAWAPLTLNATSPLRDALPTPPTTARDFSQTDTLTVFAEVYDNKGSRSVQVRAELRQPALSAVLRLSEDVAIDRARASGGYGVTLKLPLTGVPPGSYVLHVETRADSGKDVASRQIPIRIR